MKMKDSELRKLANDVVGDYNCHKGILAILIHGALRKVRHDALMEAAELAETSMPLGSLLTLPEDVGDAIGQRIRKLAEDSQQ